MIEQNLLLRIAELEQALVDVRESAASNLENPGNENDTLDYVVSVVNSCMNDNYVYVEEAE